MPDALAGPHQSAGVELLVGRGEQHQPPGVGRQLRPAGPQYAAQGAVGRQRARRGRLAAALLRGERRGPGRPGPAGCRRPAWRPRRRRRPAVPRAPGRPASPGWSVVELGHAGARHAGEQVDDARLTALIRAAVAGRVAKSIAMRSACRSAGPRTRARPATGGRATARRRRSTAPAGSAGEPQQAEHGGGEGEALVRRAAPGLQARARMHRLRLRQGAAPVDHRAEQSVQAGEGQRRLLLDAAGGTT